MINKSSDKDSDSDVPADYIFPEVYVLWGPFAEPDNRLPLFLGDGKGRSKVQVKRKELCGKEKI